MSSCDQPSMQGVLHDANKEWYDDTGLRGSYDGENSSKRANDQLWDVPGVRTHAQGTKKTRDER